jgi:hypothetical protein
VNKESVASMQIMITNRMRAILVDDLQYLPEEVDVMEPQIAAFVIEKNLFRPSKGMPDTWKKNAQPVGNKVAKSSSNKSGELGSILKRFAHLATTVAKIALPTAVFALAVIKTASLNMPSTRIKVPTISKPSGNFNIFKKKEAVKISTEPDTEFLENINLSSWGNLLTIRASNFFRK